MRILIIKTSSMGDVIHTCFGKPFGGEHMPRLLEDRLFSDTVEDRVQRFHVFNLPCGRLIVKGF